MQSLSDQILTFRRQGVGYEEINQHFLRSGVERQELHHAFEEIANTTFDLGIEPQKRSVLKPVVLTGATILLCMISLPFIGSWLQTAEKPVLNEVETVEAEPASEIETSREAEVLGSATVDIFQTTSTTASAEVASAAAKPAHSASVSSKTSSPTKLTYTIAIYGDSMEDTMGEKLDRLAAELQAQYPSISFQLYNYGIGAENVSMGLARFETEFSYKTRHYPPVSQLKPDILILGSYAYNPFIPYDRNQHWLEYSQLIERALATGADVYVLAEIAPLQTGFGVGPSGVNWPTLLANEQSEHIKEQLTNVVGLAALKEVPLVNAFAASELGAGWGNKAYVSTNDGIHPSEEGQKLMAKLIAQQLELK